MSIENNFPYTYLVQASPGNYILYPLVQPAQFSVREGSNNLASQDDERFLSLLEKSSGTAVQQQYPFTVDDPARTHVEVRYTYNVSGTVKETRFCRLNIADHDNPPASMHLRPHLYLRRLTDGLLYLHIALRARDGHRFEFDKRSMLDKGNVPDRQLHIQEIDAPGQGAQDVELSLQGYAGDHNDATTVLVYEVGDAVVPKAKGVVRHSNADNKPF